MTKRKGGYGVVVVGGTIVGIETFCWPSRRGECQKLNILGAYLSRLTFLFSSACLLSFRFRFVLFFLEYFRDDNSCDSCWTSNWSGEPPRDPRVFTFEAGRGPRARLSPVGEGRLMCQRHKLIGVPFTLTENLLKTKDTFPSDDAIFTKFTRGFIILVQSFTWYWDRRVNNFSVYKVLLPLPSFTLIKGK